jgi:hypothetical protein
MGRWKENKGKNSKVERKSGQKNRILSEKKEKKRPHFQLLIQAYVINCLAKRRKGGKIFRAKVERFSCEGKALARK